MCSVQSAVVKVVICSVQLWNWAVFSAMVKVGLIPEETRLEQDMPPNCSTTLSWEGGGGLGRAWGWGWWFGWVKGCFTMCKKINVFNVHVRQERSCSFHNPGFRHSCASIVRAAEANFNSSGIQTDWPKFLVQTRFCGEWNLAQTPQTNLKSHEAKPSEI